MLNKKADKIVALFSIIQRGKGAQFIKTLEARNVIMHFQFIGAGTASSEMMDILGLGNNDKDILISLADYKTITSLSNELGKNVGAGMGMGGLSMVISLNAVSRISEQIIRRNRDENEDKGNGGSSSMHSEYKYSLILISVNRGFTDSVMQTAKKAGATGGTVIKARLAEGQIIEAYANTKLNEEKEIVTILAPDSVRNQILEDVNREFGLKSEAQGVVLSVPVDKVFKI
ncbi:MAG: hypothetical protein J6K52_00395 [Clostridia bacterium]|nr:hypothetical protein [Clostridia bacterium]MBO5092035.1 hypothetical protein [Clostridia bacterium]MBP3494649.1 hypothetical protein [Clostridia bacterium]MBQ7788546.1 hypothetical protein [Clostridia bacterium]